MTTEIGPMFLKMVREGANSIIPNLEGVMQDISLL